MILNPRQTAATALFAVFSTAWLVWWSGDYRLVNVTLMSALGIVTALIWAWGNKRYGRWD